MRGRFTRCAALAAAAFLFAMTPHRAAAQVAAEPAMLTAGVPSTETFQLHMAFPENAFVIGGMMRFPVERDVDIGGRAGLWFPRDGDTTPYVGGDLRYGLLSRPLTPRGGELNLSFAVGLGVSDPGPTLWRIPVGFVTGLGFGIGGEAAEVFVHPRIDLGFATSGDTFDGALLLDFGGYFTISPPLGTMIDVRFGNGVFNEGDQVVVALGALWHL